MINNVLQDNELYDLNNTKFIKKINKLKTKYNNVFLLDKTEEKLEDKHKLCDIESILFDNILINNKYYSVYNLIPGEKLDKNNLYIGQHLKVLKLKGKYIDYKLWREYLPYILEITEKGIYLLNRDYSYIDMNTKYIGDIVTGGERIYLFGNMPFNNKEYDSYKKKYNNLIELDYQGYTINNMTTYTTMFLNL